MKYNPVLILGIAVIVALFAVLFMWPVETGNNSVRGNPAADDTLQMNDEPAMAALSVTDKPTFELSIVTDKEVYDEGDPINITLVVEASVDLEGAEFNVNAVQNKRWDWKIR